MQSKVILANQVELNLTRFASGERACSLLTLPVIQQLAEDTDLDRVQ